MLHIIWSIIVGFVVGLIARALMPGVEHLGFWLTSLIGIGGFRRRRPHRHGAPQTPARLGVYIRREFLLSILGAVILLYALRHMAV